MPCPPKNLQTVWHPRTTAPLLRVRVLAVCPPTPHMASIIAGLGQGWARGPHLLPFRPACPVQTDNTPNCRLATLFLPASCLPLNLGETGGRCLRLEKCVQVARRPLSQLEIGRGTDLPVLTSWASSVCLLVVRGVANHPPCGRR